MGKFRDKRKAKKNEKRSSKYGVNPVTGKGFSKKQYKVVKKRGLNKDGNVMSKMEGKLQYGNVGTRRQRVDMRENVRTTRSNNGNTLGESIASAVGQAFGGGESFEENVNPVSYKNRVVDDYGNQMEDVGSMQEPHVLKRFGGAESTGEKKTPLGLIIGGIVGAVVLVGGLIWKFASGGKKKGRRY